MKIAEEIERAIFETATYLGFSEKELKSASKIRELADMRKIIIAALRQKTDLNTIQIGNVLNLSHSNVCVQTGVHQNLVDTSIAYKKRFESFCEFFDSRISSFKRSEGKVEVPA